MKYIVSIFLISIYTFTFSQSDFKVIKVNGTILNQTSNANLSLGATFKDNDKLEFKSVSARAAVIAPGKGRYVLMAKSSGAAYAKSYLTPAMSNISSRSGALVNKTDLINHFSGKYIVFNTIKLQISNVNFPMDANNFFYIRYEYKGEKINKKLSYENDILIITQKELLTVDNRPIPNPDIGKMELFYFKKSDNSSMLINSFDPVFLNNEDLKAEVKLILESVEGKTKKEKVDEVLGYINDFYGKPNKENMEVWLSQNFKL